MIKKLLSNLPSRKGITGINRRNLDLIYPNNARIFFPNVDDKIKCKELLGSAGLPLLETYFVADSHKSINDWEKNLDGVDRFVIKPNKSYGGLGIIIVKRTDDGYFDSDRFYTAEDISFHLKMIYGGAFSLDNTSDIAYFEQMAENDKLLNQFIPEGFRTITDIRLIFQNEKPVMGMLRAPTKKSKGKANLHQGGIGIGIDIQTGITRNGCMKNDLIDKHPDTGMKLAGVQVPGFEKMIEVGSRISQLVGLGYIGIDFVADNNLGPVILEVNARPGLNIQLANQYGIGKRLNEI